MLKTPENIRTLQRKLYHKAKREPACRFHALYDKVCRVDILSHADALVRANKGSAGIDGVTFEAIEEQEGVAAFIAELEEALRNKTYKPDPVRRVMIPKSDGSQRPLGIPTIRDRVAQMATSPQGGVISPLLANIYLHILDRIWERHNLRERLGARIVRYADDIVILCRSGKSDEAMAMLRQILERLELTLNVAKTKVVDAYAGKFDFLGFTAWMGKGIKTGKYYPHIQPSKKAEQKVKDRITELTKRDRTIMPLEWVVNEVNTMLRGWVGYFHYRNCSQTLSRVRNHLEQRLITHLRKRHKVRDRKTGYVRFPNRSLYGKYGLYKVPTTAGWTKAHALR
jgi:hypothetical protein